MYHGDEYHVRDGVGQVAQNAKDVEVERHDGGWRVAGCGCAGELSQSSTTRELPCDWRLVFLFGSEVMQQQLPRRTERQLATWTEPSPGTYGR